MTNRENFFKAMKRKTPSWVPFGFELCPSHIEKLREKIGTEDYFEYYKFPYRFIDINKTNKIIDMRKYYGEIADNVSPILWNPDWGILGETGSVAHFQKMLHPMANIERIEELEDYPFPDFLEEYRWEGMSQKINEIKDRDLVSVGFMEMTTFEIAWYLRGMDSFMIDLMINKEFAKVLLDIITELHSGKARKFAEAGADVVMLGDDIATQRDMMMNPDLWRQMIKPHLAEVIKSAKTAKKDILVLYHSDGNIEKVIPDLIEIGVDILNPVQPECMDPVEIKENYGNRLSFWGTLGTQTVLPFGTPTEVRNECKKMIEKVGDGGGLLLAPTHVVEPEVPWENLLAFLEAVSEFGQY